MKTKRVLCHGHLYLRGIDARTRCASCRITDAKDHNLKFFVFCQGRSSWPRLLPIDQILGMQAPVESLKVHRCRFVDWTPSPITSIAFPPPSLHPKSFNEPKIGLLAVGRANGNIELSEWTGSPTRVQAHQAWVLRKVIKFDFCSFRLLTIYWRRYPGQLPQK